MSYRGMLLASAFGVGLSVVASAAYAADLPARAIDVPAGQASKSITVFARQADVQVLAPAANLEGRRTSPVHGVYSPREGLARMLKGTELEISSEAGSTFVIRSNEPVVNRGLVVKTANAGSFQLAQASAPPPPPVAAPDLSTSSETITETEAVVVTGSRITTGFSAPTPVTVVGQANLQQRAPASMAEALQELPSFRNSAGPTQSTRLIGGAGQQPANMRGLGTGRTLVLVDGRRYVGSSDSFAPDLATIPTSLVERVDIVTGGASAAYGSDAVAGVVNFIMSDRLQGLRGNAQYGISNYGKGMEYVASLGFGIQSKDGRVRFIAGGDYTKTNGIESFYSNKWFKGEPGQVSYGAGRGNLPAQALLGSNVQSFYTPGGIITTGPLRGTAVTPGGQVYQASLGTVFGQTMIGTSNYGTNTQQIQALSNPFERKNAMARFSFDVSPSLTVFAEGNYAWNTNAGGHGDTFLSTGIVVPDTNPFIPTAIRQAMAANRLTSITVGRFNNDIGPWRVFTEWELKRGVVGARGKINSKWDWDVHLQHGQTVQDYNSTPMIDRPNLNAATYVVNGPNGQPVCGPSATNPNLTAADAAIVEAGCIPFNIFGQTNTQAAKDYVTGSVTSHNVISQTSGALTFNGSLFDLPAGPVALAFGGEFRKDSVDAKGDPRSELLAWQTVNQSTYKGSDSVKEAFAELGVPIFKDQVFFRELSLNGAIRRTDYKSSGAVTTWKIGATWEPSDFLRMRITQSRDIKAPNPSQLYSAAGSGGLTGVLNPFTGQVGRLTTISGGNPALVPEVAKTLTAGLVFTPQWGITRGFRASIDVFKIKIDGVIAALAAVDTLNGCFRGNAALCQYVIRDNSLYGLQSVAGLPQNLNKLETKGVDLEFVYQVPMSELGLPGQLVLRDLTTIVNQLDTTSNSSVRKQAGFMTGVAHMQGVLTATYTLNRFSGSLQARYFDKVRWDDTRIGPDDRAYDPASSASVNRNLYPGIVYLNLNASYDLISRGNRKLQVYGVVNNLLNKRPSLLGATAANITGTQLYDTVGQFFRVGVRFQY